MPPVTNASRHAYLFIDFFDQSLYCVGEQAPAPDAAPVATAEVIPIVTISYKLDDLSVETFTPDLKTSLVEAIVATLPTTSNVDVYLTNIRPGSVAFDTVVRFLDGNNQVAQALSTAVADQATVSPSPPPPPPPLPPLAAPGFSSLQDRAAIIGHTRRN